MVQKRTGDEEGKESKTRPSRRDRALSREPMVEQTDPRVVCYATDSLARINTSLRLSIAKIGDRLSYRSYTRPNLGASPAKACRRAASTAHYLQLGWCSSLAGRLE